MDEAIVVFSRKGIFQTTIAARDVRSREHARKLWPLVSPGASRQMVTWVSPFLREREVASALPFPGASCPAHLQPQSALRR
jgi:hypothetical protein